MAFPVAEEILRQFGGNKFIAMTGSWSFAGGPDSLSFRVPNAKKKIRGVMVKLMPNDLYEVRFVSQKPFPDCEVYDVAKYDNVFCDMLQELFTKETGLYTSL
jgi:hypothetical protein